MYLWKWQLLAGAYPKDMTAIEVRNALEDASNSDDVSLSACHAALKRMLSDGEVETGPARSGKTTYRRVLKLPESPNLIALLAGLTTPGYFSTPPAPLPEQKAKTIAEIKKKLQENLPK